MKKKTAVVMITLLTLTLLLTMPYYVPQSAAGGPPYHYKIKLSQLCSIAKVKGNLTDVNQNPIANFTILCCQGYAEWKVTTIVPVNDIDFYIYIDWDKDCVWDTGYNPQRNTVRPITLPYQREWVLVVGGKEKKVKLEVTELTTPLHWKIKLAQEDCNAWIIGSLSDKTGLPIPCTDFVLNCSYGDFVYKKVVTPNCTIPHDINFTLWVDWDKDHLWDPEDIVAKPISSNFEVMSECKPTEKVRQWPWQYVVYHPGWPTVRKMVVVELEEHDYDPSDGWQITIEQKGANAMVSGWLTDKAGVAIAVFGLTCEGTQQQCVVVKIPWCTEPYDIHFSIWIDWDRDVPPTWDPPYNPMIVDALMPQFPWTWRTPTSPEYVKLEVDEVQMHPYVLMGGEMDSAGSLGPGRALWKIGDWAVIAGTPFRSRAPYLDPGLMGSNITFTQRNPITGIVKLAIPAESYIGLKHVWWGNDTKIWFNMSITMKEQGCGYLFTGQGKDPILGDVDIFTYNDYSGVYSKKPGFVGTLLAGPIDPIEFAYPAYGAGPPIGPCLKELSGTDGIPGTGDDPIGDGKLDPPGSAILYQPTFMKVDTWSTTEGKWVKLFSSPWPQLMTTGNATDTVNESGSLINGERGTAKGAPFEFFAGLDHPEYCNTSWKHPKCNAYFTTACAWSVLSVNTALNWLDIVFYVQQKLVRKDCVIADIDCNEICDIFDLVKIGIAYNSRDEGPGLSTRTDPWGGPAGCVSDPNYDARGDLKPTKGLIDIFDLVTVGIDYNKKLTPNCIIRP